MWWITPSSNKINYITHSYLDLTKLEINFMVKDDMDLWNQEYTDNPFMYEFQLEVNYQEQTVHLRIIYRSDMMPLMHIHRWNLSKQILDEYSYIGQRYMSQENKEWMCQCCLKNDMRTSISYYLQIPLL